MVERNNVDFVIMKDDEKINRLRESDVLIHICCQTKYAQNDSEERKRKSEIVQKVYMCKNVS